MSTASQTLVLLFFVVVFLVLIIKPGQDRQSRPTPTATIYGASETAGGYCVPPDATLLTVSPTPCQMTSQAGPVKVIDRSINGLKLSELLTGGPVALGVPGIGTDGCTVVALRDQLKTDPSQIIVLGAGMVDCLFTDVGIGTYMDMVRAAVAEIRANGKTPVIRGYNQFVQNDLVTPQRMLRRDIFNRTLALWCATNAVEFIDIDAQPFAGQADMAPDGLHRTAASHQQLAAFIAGRLKQIAGV